MSSQETYDHLKWLDFGDPNVSRLAAAIVESALLNNKITPADIGQPQRLLKHISIQSTGHKRAKGLQGLSNQEQVSTLVNAYQTLETELPAEVYDKIVKHRKN